MPTTTTTGDNAVEGGGKGNRRKEGQENAEATKLTVWIE